MDQDGKPKGVIREGEGIACGPDNCLTLDGAYHRIRTVFLSHHPGSDTVMLDKAFKVGRAAHANQRRRSGEPYFFHPLSVSLTLATWRLDAVSIACGLLHDTVEDTILSLGDIRIQFGSEVAEIVDGLTKLSKLEITDRALLNAENVRKLLVAMGKDVRVLLVKLADRLHNMRTLGAMREEKARRIAHETLELYAPLANRLGMGLCRAELEDLAFKALEPERYRELKAALDAKHQANASLVAEIKGTLESALRSYGIEAQVSGRAKHLYGVWKKMGVQAKGLEDIHDWLAYRIVCPDRASCYTALGVVHALFKTIPGRFKDYISLPKENGYQSIHTSVLMPSGDSFEVQFRTPEMHEMAEKGIAAHWTYKEGRIANPQEINQISFLRRMVELHQEARDSRELVANLKGELSFSRIQVFTPKGDLRSLPEKSTPIDFAYSIHTQVGHRCVGAKVNDRMVSLKYVLRNGDRVEILTRADHKPSRDWLGIVKSAGARAKIQAFIREEERAQAIAMGKDRLEKEARTVSIHLEDPEVRRVLEKHLHELKFDSWDAFHAAVGFNRVPVQRLLEPLLPSEAQKAKERAGKLAEALDATVLVDENIGVLYSLAKCCKPIWGDEIAGYTTRGRGITIHRANCPHLNSSVMNPERRVSVAWGRQGSSLFEAEVAITTEDKPGMVASISSAIQHAGINVQRFSASTTEEGSGLIFIAFPVKDRVHLVEVMGLIRRVKGVFTVERVRGSVFGSGKAK